MQRDPVTEAHLKRARADKAKKTKHHGSNGPMGPDPPPPEPLIYVDISKWINAQVPKREWEVLNRIPAKNVTVLSGTGGIGKTIVAMMLAAAIVLARD
jgi:Mrp family chromosome partitioning ATPase